MTILKLILVIFIWANLTFCSQTAKKPNNIVSKVLNLDTTYYKSTQQLKSNKIPDSVFQMIELRHLAISGMDCDYGDHLNCWEINELPPQISNLKKMTTLRLTVNSISKIPVELAALKNLKLIDLSDNAGLVNFGGISQLSSLEYLYLYGCGLTKLPDNIGDFKNLKELGLVGNKLDKTEQARIKNALPNCVIKF